MFLFSIILYYLFLKISRRCFFQRLSKFDDGIMLKFDRNYANLDLSLIQALIIIFLFDFKGK